MGSSGSSGSAMGARSSARRSAWICRARCCASRAARTTPSRRPRMAACTPSATATPSAARVTGNAFQSDDKIFPVARASACRPYSRGAPAASPCHTRQVWGTTRPCTLGATTSGSPSAISPLGLMPGLGLWLSRLCRAPSSPLSAQEPTTAWRCWNRRGAACSRRGVPGPSSARGRCCRPWPAPRRTTSTSGRAGRRATVAATRHWARTAASCSRGARRWRSTWKRSLAVAGRLFCRSIPCFAWRRCWSTCTQTIAAWVPMWRPS
mmetsp:Transcript_59389/g.181143  ORF Transcript_59389/g.181143 Transcript_59389/m.181143 type:complete len:265 (-) Transcript_59389:803-1597(-)